MMRRQSILAGCLVVATAALDSAPANATELRVVGRSSVSMKDGKPADVRATADFNAKMAAVAAAVDKTVGAGASERPEIANKLLKIGEQVTRQQLGVRRASVVEGAYEVVATYVFDTKEFRKLLLDMGIAGASGKARQFSIMVIMDEFLTLPKDLRAPVEELITYRRERGASASDSATRAQKSSDATRVSGRAVNGTRVHGARVSKTGRSVSAKRERSTHDNEFFQRLVRYQPQGGKPEKTSKTGNALVAQLNEQDIRVLDSDAFRSSYFKGAPMTLNRLADSGTLKRFVRLARKDANADFFLVGTSVVIKAGKNGNTGDEECTGVMSAKVYSTASQELIGSVTTSESGAGQNINQCAGNLAVKMARIGGSKLGTTILEYWKRRSMFGREFNVVLLGQKVSFRLRLQLSKVLKGVKGIEAVQQRSASSTKLAFTMKYKGSEPLDQAIGAALMDLPEFAELDAVSEGNLITMCTGPCGPLMKPVPSPPSTVAAPTAKVP